MGYTQKEISKNLCEKDIEARQYFSEIWLAKTLWILEDWEKISKSKNSPEEKIIKNNTILDFNISEDKLKQMLRRKPYKRGKDPKTKQIWRMYIKGYETNDIIAMLKLPKEFVLRAKKRLIIELKKELRRTKNAKM